MVKKSYLYLDDPWEIEYHIESLVNYINSQAWHIALEDVELHIDVIKKQLRGMGEGYEVIADLCNSVSDAHYAYNLSNYNVEPFVDALKCCYMLKQYLIPDKNTEEALIWVEKLGNFEKGVALDVVCHARIQEARRGKKAGAESVKARRIKNEARDKALIDKAKSLISGGTKAYKITGIIAKPAMGFGLSKKQIRNILQNNGVLPKRTQKGK